MPLGAPGHCFLKAQHPRGPARPAFLPRGQISIYRHWAGEPKKLSRED
jgi:hypothetical protein